MSGKNADKYQAGSLRGLIFNEFHLKGFGSLEKMEVTKLDINELDPEVVGTLDDDSLVALESLDESCIDTILDACYLLFGDRRVNGEFAVIPGTPYDFERSRKRNWSEKGSRSVVELAGGESAVLYRNVQYRKGDRKRSLLVIDLGNVCLAITRW